MVEAAGPRGNQEQHCPFGRFFQKLQQGVRTVAVHEVHEIDDGDTPAAAGLVAETRRLSIWSSLIWRTCCP